MSAYRPLALAGVLAALAVQPAAAATALNGALSATATSNIGRPALATDSQTEADSWTGGAFRDLSVAASATATLGADSVTTQTTESARWVSADQGSVRITDAGHEFDVSDGAINQIETFLGTDSAHPDWSYDFRADADGTFALDFAVSGEGDSLFGLGDWRLAFFTVGPPESTTLSVGFTSDPSDVLHTGTFSHGLVAGQTYRVALFNNNSLGSFTPNHQSATSDARFDWSITEGGVPEPAAWALMIAGFAMTGAGLRARRRTFGRFG